MARQLLKPPAGFDVGDVFADKWVAYYRFGRNTRGVRIIRELTITREPGSPVPEEGLTVRALRQVRLGRALRYARATWIARLLRPPRQRLGRPLTRPQHFYAKVARRYQALAGLPNVLELLTKESDLSYSTMRGVVARCRRMGLLGASGRTRTQKKRRRAH